MDMHTNIPLRDYTTMKLGGPALYMTEAHTPDDVAQVYKHATSQSLPVFVLGGGSNVIARDEGYNGIVLRMCILGFEIINDDENTTTIKIGAGEQWDSAVKRTVDMHLSGIEALSGIPGTTGAAPVQNIGAYGQELAETMVSLQAYDTVSDSVVTLQNADCGFAYRHSIFRGESTGRYVILSVTLALSKAAPRPPFYESLQVYLDKHHTTIYTPTAVRDAVLAIRADKLPDPALLPNTGSFFKNAIVDSDIITELQTRYPDITTYDMGDGKSKIPTGWLIEQAGFKAQLLHGMRVHDKNTLVLINESAASYHDLAAARDEIIGKVHDLFGVDIVQEPLEIPA